LTDVLLSLVVEDLSRDGTPDIVSGHSRGAVSVHLASGGTFLPARRFSG
jgi:hypothetical protein